MTDAAPDSEKATLHFPGGSAEFPVIRGTDGHDSIDISTFTKQTGFTTLDQGFVNTASTRSASMWNSVTQYSALETRNDFTSLRP